MGASSRGALPRIFAVLLIYGNIGTSAAFSDLNLTCTNDYDKKMICRFDAPNCGDYTVKVWDSDEPREKFNCRPKNCTDGSCCCPVEELGILVTGDVHTASVLTGGQSVVSKNFSVIENFIPKPPIIQSANESNGNLQLVWTSNYNGRTVLQQQLEAEVIYRKEGSQEEHSSGLFSPSLDKELSYYEIPGQDLEPSTTYFVRVRSYFNGSGRYSVSSQEHKFKTTASFQPLLLTFIVGLSFFAVMISAIIYVCYIKLKAKWWDSVSEYSNPKLLNINPNKQEVLKLVPPIVSPIYVEPLVPFDGKPWSKDSLTGSSSSESLVESSGISTGSSSLSYAKTEPGTIIAGVQEALSMALNINPGIPVTLSPLTQPNPEGADILSTSCNPCDVQARDWSSGSSGFDNKTYAIVLTSQSRAEIPCDSAYRTSQGSSLPHVDEQPSACTVPASQNSISLPESLLLARTNTDMLHQKQSGDSGFSCTSNSCSSPSSSGTNTMAEEVKCEDSTVFDENPCYGAMPTASHSFPPVEDVYQAFQSLVEQPVVSFSEQRNGEQGQHADVFSHVGGSSSMIPPSQTGASINGEFPSPLQRPLFSLISANQPPSIIMDSGYQKV